MPFGVRGAAEGGGLVGRAEEALLVVQVGPSTFFAGGDKFSGRVETAGFASVCHFYKSQCVRMRGLRKVGCGSIEALRWGIG